MATVSPHRDTSRRKISLASGTNVALGLWLIVAPTILAYGSPDARWNDIIVGMIISVLAWARISKKQGTRWLSRWNTALGAWLILAPFTLGYTAEPAKWNDIIVGSLVVILGGWSATMRAGERASPEQTRDASNGPG